MWLSLPSQLQIPMFWIVQAAQFTSSVAWLEDEIARSDDWQGPNRWELLIIWESCVFFCFSYLTGCLEANIILKLQHSVFSMLKINSSSVFKAQFISFLWSSLASFSSVFWLLAWPTTLLFAVHSQRSDKPRLQLFLIVKVLKIRLQANCAALNSSWTKLKLKHVNTVELLAAKFWAKYFPHELV